MMISRLARALFPRRPASPGDQPPATEDEALDRLLAFLKIVDRTILPRTLTLESEGRRLELDVAGQRVLALPRSGGAYLLDASLMHEAPEACAILAQGPQALPRWEAELGRHRAALMASTARTLSGFIAGSAALNYEVRPLLDQRRGEAAAFGSLEILAAVRTGGRQNGAVQAFFSHLAPAVKEAWLFSASGWPVAFPEGAKQVSDLEPILDAARMLLRWRQRSHRLTPGPLLSFLTAYPEDGIWCAAIDAEHIALFGLMNAQLGAAMAAWRGFGVTGGNEKYPP